MWCEYPGASQQLSVLSGGKHTIDSYKMWVMSVKVTAQMMNLSVPVSYK